jgi:hypothetical protein
VRDRVARGDSRVADAVRGSWVHLTAGGWLQHALPDATAVAAPAEVPAGPVRPPRKGTAPAVSWSVLTLGTGLAVELRDLSDEEAVAVAPLHRLFADSVRIVAFGAAARGRPQYSFRFPPKAGRFRLQMADRPAVESLDPFAVARAPGVTEDDVARAFPTASLTAGQTWAGLILLPPDAELGAATAAWVDVGGREHRLFMVPGPGGSVEE